MDTQTVICPVCGQSAVLTLVEDREIDGRGEGHSMIFDCVGAHRELADVDKLKLWAAQRAEGRRTAGTPHL